MVSIYDRRTRASLDNVALRHVLFGPLPLSDDVQRDTGKNLPSVGVEARPIVELVAALGAPVPHLYLAGLFVKKVNRLDDTLGFLLEFLLGLLAVLFGCARGLGRASACRADEHNRERRQFDIRFQCATLSMSFASMSLALIKFLFQCNYHFVSHRWTQTLIPNQDIITGGMASQFLRLKDLVGLDTQFLAPAAAFELGYRT